MFKIIVYIFAIIGVVLLLLAGNGFLIEKKIEKYDNNLDLSSNISNNENIGKDNVISNGETSCKKFKRNEETVEAFQLGIDKMPDWFIEQLRNENIYIKTVTKNMNVPIEENYLKYAMFVNRSGEDSYHRNCFTDNPYEELIKIRAILFRDNADDGDYIVRDKNGDMHAYHENAFKRRYTEIPVLKSKENIKILSVDMACKVDDV